MPSILAQFVASLCYTLRKELNVLGVRDGLMPFVHKLLMRIILVLSIDETIIWHCPDCVVAISELPFADCSISASISDSSMDGVVHAAIPGSVHQPLLCTCFNARSIVNKQLDLYAMLTDDVTLYTTV